MPCFPIDVADLVAGDIRPEFVEVQAASLEDRTVFAVKKGQCPTVGEDEHLRLDASEEAGHVQAPPLRRLDGRQHGIDHGFHGNFLNHGIESENDPVTQDPMCEVFDVLRYDVVTPLEQCHGAGCLAEGDARPRLAPNSTTLASLGSRYCEALRVT